MAGIYIHIPFCRQTCHYCDFHFSTNLKQKEKLTEAILLEIEQRKGFFAPEEIIETIYFGGGTPSVLEPELLQNILKKIKKKFKIVDPEISIETNPDDITKQNLDSWHKMGFNRISLGVQTFNQESLTFMNRNHSSEKAVEAINLIRNSKFNNISLDLIFGIHDLTMESFLKDLEKFISIKPEHISTYCLTIEENTTFGKWFQQKKIDEVDQELSSKQYLTILDKLSLAGYEQYEISNFSLPNYKSKHNSSYWDDKKYLGLGPSAHSYDGVYRYENIKPNAVYIKKVNENLGCYEQEFISPETRFNETVLTQLRKNTGLNLSKLKKDSPNFWAAENEQNLQKHLKEKLVLIDKGFVKLTRKGKLYADSICEDLLYLK